MIEDIIYIKYTMCTTGINSSSSSSSSNSGVIIGGYEVMICHCMSTTTTTLYTLYSTRINLLLVFIHHSIVVLYN